MDTSKIEGGEKSLFVLDCKMGSGHFGSTGRYAYIKEIAQDYAFVIDRILGKIIR
jgi:oligopeptidase B